MKYRFLRFILIITGIVAHSSSFSQAVDHWETVFRVGDSCRYVVPDSSTGTDWQKRDFDASSWEMGQSGFGFGDGDDSTLITGGTTAVYMRIEFNVRSKSDIADLYLEMDYDDGFVAYINGTEVARANVQDPVSWDMELAGFHEAVMYYGVRPERWEIGAYIGSVLDTGRNVLAVEVHNENASSGDLTSNVFLHAGITVADSLYGPVPGWFADTVSFSEFNLPLMLIHTHGQDIPDEPRIVADMALIKGGEGVINSLDDPRNEYDGKISIELRGESSMNFAKKSYSIELQNADGSNNNVSILGLPEENDFVLYGPFSDQTLVKNVLSYELFRRTGRWAPRTRYMELVLNDDYKGIYVFTEKIKRDNNRVDIDKLSPEDVSALDISGGYILRRDKTKKSLAEEWWESPVKQPYHRRMWYAYFDPEYDELTPDQYQYIRDWMQNFDEVMSGEDFADPENGYRKYIRTRSFIDLMFINEISKGVDNYHYSAYFHKENDIEGGQLVAGPPWDYNLAYGNLGMTWAESWDAKESYGWCYPQHGRTYWFERLMEDEQYLNQVYCRWTKHRKGIFSDESIMAVIDSCVQHMGDAVDRNFARYTTLGKYVWPAAEPYPETYEGEIDKLKTWLIARLAWMDSQWLNQGVCHQAPTDIMLSNHVIPENQALGTIIGILSSLDSDSDSHEYSFVSGVGDKDNAKFAILDSFLVSKEVFDYQRQDTLSVRIASTDKTGESFQKAFEIEVTSTASSKERAPGGITFLIYPNPSSDFVQIRSTAIGRNSISVQLLALTGIVLNTYNGQLDEINSRLSRDSRALDQGLYFVRINLEGHTTTKKFIKH